MEKHPEIKYGKDIRKAFTAKKGHLLISADYNQIEMRILADLADVKELKEKEKQKNLERKVLR